jgi:hypothetical protein
MRKLIKKFMLWVMGANEKRDEDFPVPVVGLGQSAEPPQASFRLGVINAANGRILEMSTYKHNNHGPNWTSELFIVPDDQTLAECISTILTIKGLT